MYEEVMLKLKEKYNYNDELLNVILIAIELLKEIYDEESILDTLLDAKIFPTNNMSIDNRKSIEKQMTSKLNCLEEIEIDPYQNTSDPGSSYQYKMIFDDNLNVIGEVKWLIVQDTKDTFLEKDYREIFNTSINLPYFLHELSHAVAMNKPYIKKQGDIINTKHGMFIESYKISNDYENKPKLVAIENNGIILEEGINELYTQRMLKTFFKKDTYEEVSEILKSINFVSTNYNAILIGLCERFEKDLSKDSINDLRNNNNFNIISDFNNKTSITKIKEKYFQNEDAYSYFCQKLFEIFKVKCNSLHYTTDEYASLQRELMVDAIAPLMAYEEYDDPEKFDNYNKKRNEILGYINKK